MGLKRPTTQCQPFRHLYYGYLWKGPKEWRFAFWPRPESVYDLFLLPKQGHGVANDHAAFDHGDQARLPKFLRFMNISLRR